MSHSHLFSWWLLVCFSHLLFYLCGIVNILCWVVCLLMGLTLAWVDPQALLLPPECCLPVEHVKLFLLPGLTHCTPNQTRSSLPLGSLGLSWLLKIVLVSPEVRLIGCALGN